jgi:hypothetical protein
MGFAPLGSRFRGGEIADHVEEEVVDSANLSPPLLTLSRPCRQQQINNLKRQ